MSRLGAIAKALYYPTPVEVVELVSSHIYKNPKATIFDPCCGTGEAVGLLASKLGAKAYGNELDEKRAEKAKRILEYATHGPMEFFECSEQFSCFFYNPPYDDSPTGLRLEVAYLKLDRFLLPGGVFIGIVPEHLAIENEAWVDHLTKLYEDIEVYRFPSNLYERFKQVVVLAKKLKEENSYSYSRKLRFREDFGEGVPDLMAGMPSYTLPDATAPIDMQVEVPEAAPMVTEAADYGVIHSPNWKALTTPQGGIEVFKPLLPLRAGHMAQLLASGFMSGVQIDSLLVKGYTNKYTTKEEDLSQNDKGEDVREVIETERLIYGIATFNVADGEYRTYDSKENPEEYEAFLISHADALTEQMREQYSSYFDCDRDYPKYGGIINSVNPPRSKPLPGQSEACLFDAQKASAAAIVHYWKGNNKAAILVGEMGFGKTTAINAACAAFLYPRIKQDKSAKVVVICPPHLVHKWKREVEATLAPLKWKGAICKTVSDVDAAMQLAKPTTLIISLQSAKNDARWEPAYTTRTQLIEDTEYDLEYITSTDHWGDTYRKQEKIPRKVKKQVKLITCPDCGQNITRTDRDENVSHLFADVPADLAYMKESKRSCESCGGQLWQRIPFKYGGRVALANYIGKNYAGNYLLVLDECFPQGTKIATPAGDVPIETIQPGDTVLSCKSGQVIPRKVVRIIQNPLLGNLVRIEHSFGSVTCTPNHKFYTSNGWIEAGNLIPGTRVSILTPDIDMYYRKILRLEDTNDNKNLPNMQSEFQGRTSYKEDVQRTMRHTTKAEKSGQDEYLPSMWEIVHPVPTARKGTDNLQHTMCSKTQMAEPHIQSDYQFSGENMRVLRQGISRQEIQTDTPVLQQILQSKGGTCETSRVSSEICNNDAHAGIKYKTFPTHENKESYVRPGNQGKSTTEVDRDRQQATNSRRKWCTASIGATDDSFDDWLAYGTCSSNGQSFVENGTSRCGKPRSQDSHRVRREYTRYPETEGSRRQEKQNIDQPGLVSSPIQKPANIGEPGRDNENHLRCSESTILSITSIDSNENIVYNLEVEDTHCYFAESILVSNCHQTKASTTDAGYASMDIAAGAKKIAAMTGTIYGGRASSLFYLAYRTLPAFRLLYDYDDVERFIDKYGLRESVTKYTREKSRYSWSSTYGYERKNTRTKEIPGTSPGMVALLLPSTAFMRLVDLGAYLPPYLEDYKSIQLNGSDTFPVSPGMLASDYEKLEKLQEEAASRAKHGDMSLLAAYLQMALGRADCPTQVESISTEDFQFDLEPLDIPEEGFNKDSKLLEFIRSELSGNRNVIVYCSQVNKRNPQPRLKEMLEREDIKVSVLRATTPPDEREEWLMQEVEKGCQVLLTNPKLVETGLDLVDFPTMVYIGIEYSVYTIRQSSRRSWRLGQDRPVKVRFLYYDGSLQADAIALIAKKLRAACYVDGDLAEGLASLGDNDNGFLKQLMKRVIEGSINHHVTISKEIEIVHPGVTSHGYALPPVARILAQPIPKTKSTTGIRITVPTGIAKPQKQARQAEQGPESSQLTMQELLIQIKTDLRKLVKAPT